MTSFSSSAYSFQRAILRVKGKRRDGVIALVGGVKTVCTLLGLYRLITPTASHDVVLLQTYSPALARDEYGNLELFPAPIKNAIFRPASDLVRPALVQEVHVPAYLLKPGVPPTQHFLNDTIDIDIYDMFAEV